MEGISLTSPILHEEYPMTVSVYAVHLLLLLLSTASSQALTTVAYAGNKTVIVCPIKGSYIIPAWRGPPYITQTGTIYTEPGRPVFNSVLGEKLARLSFADNQRDLLLSDVRLSDSGMYQCILNNGGTTGDNVLEVRIFPNPPEITANVQIDNNGVRAVEGSAFTVTCSSRGGYPAPTVVWYRGSTAGQPLLISSTETQVGNTFTVALAFTLTPTRQDDRQRLVCRSFWPTPADAQGSLETSITLYLHIKPLRPIIAQTSIVVAGSDVAVECRTSESRPAANISWMYRGQIYTTFVIITNDSSTQTFTTVSVLRRSVSAIDNGQAVLCRVTHIALDNELTASAPLNVQFPVGLSTTSITGNRVVVADGVNQLSLNCTTGSSNPPADIFWRNGSDVIPNNNAYTNTTGENNGVVRSQSVLLTPTRYDHGLNISCSATNGVNQFTDTVAVTLDLFYSPRISDIPARDVVEGDSLVVPCHASSNPPASFTWRKGPVVVTNGSGSTSFNGLNYTIHNASRTQAGAYTCTAENPVPLSDFKLTELRVLYPPDITVNAINTTVNSSATTVTCEASGVPNQYTYEGWVHTWNGHVVTHTGPLPATRVLTLTGLTYAHSGVYTCGASNGIKGVSHGAGTLVVKSPPIIVRDLANSREIRAFGQIMRPLTVTFHYYSNVGRGTVIVRFNSSAVQTLWDVHQRDVAFAMPVFLSEIDTTGIEATINITVVDKTNFGEYEIVVRNEVGSVSLSLIIQPETPPTSDADSSSGAVIGGVVGGGLVGTLVVVVGVFRWRRRGMPLLGRHIGKRKNTESAGKRDEIIGLEGKNKKHERTAEKFTESIEVQPYETLQTTGDIQCYEQLQTNRTTVLQHEYENTATSPYESLHRNGEGDAQTYDQLQRDDPENQPKVYENMKLASK